MIFLFTTSNFVVLIHDSPRTVGVMFQDRPRTVCRSRLVILESNLQCFGMMRKSDLTGRSHYVNCLKCKHFFPFSVCIEGKKQLSGNSNILMVKKNGSRYFHSNLKLPLGKTLLINKNFSANFNPASVRKLLSIQPWAEANDHTFIQCMGTVRIPKHLCMASQSPDGL